MNPIMKPGLLSIAVSAVVLSACGESDLPEHHREALAQEQLKQEEAEVAAATADNEDSFAPAAAVGESEDNAGANAQPAPDNGADSQSTGESNSADSATDAGTDNEPDTGADAEPDATADAEPDTGTDGEPDATTDAEPDTGADAEPDATADSETDAGTDAQAESGAGAEPDAGTDEAPVDEESSVDETDAGTTPVQEIDLQNDFTLVFSDEFSGDTVDPLKWKTAFEWGPDLEINEQEQYYVDTENSPDFGYNPFSFDNGVLSINAMRTPESLAESANDQPWLSGVLTTATRFDFQYGYIEARVDLPTGNALWSSFWMLSSNYTETELRPRIFISEYDGGRPDSIFHNYEYEDADGAVRSPGQFEVEDTTLADGFHTIGLSWTPEDLVFYVDDEPRYRVVGDNLPQQDMYLILNLAIGGVWVDASDATTPDPASFQIDYVRVYERNAP